MKKSSNRLVAILPCKFSTFVLIIVIIASLLLLPSPTLSKYVLDPIQDVLTLTSSGFSGMELTSISPIIGTTVPGEMLTAGSLQPQDATASYKWQRSSSPAGEYVDIPGATLNTYYLTVDDNNSYIRVVATGTEHYYGTVESEYTGPVITAALPVISIEPIVGAPYVGQQLVAGAVAPEVATVTYQWQKSDTLTGTYRNIEGAVGNTYTLTEEDVDKFIKVVARGSGSYGGSVGANIGPIRSNVTPLIDISPIVGSTEVGKTLVAGDLSPSGATADYQWQSSNSAAGPYTDIGGANSNTYILKNSDSGKYIKVKANGTGAYSESVVSAYTGPVATSSTPIQTIGPITGSSRVGETLTAGSITPQGATITYQWLRANAANGIYSPISGANNSTYVLKTEDYNKYIKVKASGAGAYSGTVESEPTDAVAACILVAIGPISGTTKVGELLTAGAMTPIGASVNYQWQRADPATGIYSNIDGATSSTYTLQTSDVGMYIRVVANGTDAYTGTVISLASSMVATAEQEITDLISIGDITGYIYIYETLTAGTVFPYGASVTHQWYRSDTAGGNYTPIAGATDKTYTLMPGDKGSYFKVAAIGSGFYSGTITSSYAGPITAIPLKSMGEITGTTKTWEMLTAGSISPIDSTVSYQWQKANAINGEYMDITGATEKTYTLAEDDESSFVRVIARGKNLYSGTLISSGTGPVSLTTTLVTSIDSIDGIPQVNHILTAGATSPVSATVTYQWQKADDLDGDYSDIVEATGSTYAVAAGDLGKYIKLVVKGSGAYETVFGGISSAAIGPVIAQPLTKISNIIGMAQVDQVLTAGSMTPYGASVNYQWQRFNNGNYVNIVGATGNTYTLTTADNNLYIRVIATAVPGSGYTGTVASNNTGPVGSPNAIIDISDITGITKVGQTLTAGTVLPYGSAVSYQWQSSDQADGTYANINGAVSANYVLTADEHGKYIRVVASGTGTYFGETISTPTDIITKGVVTAISPISGQTVVGELLTAGVITPLWATVSYQWQRSDVSGNNYTDINGAISSSYALTAADQGRLIKIVVSGTGAYEGTASTVTNQNILASGTTLIPVVNIAATTGTARVGQTLVAGKVSPEGATVTYQWKRADEPEGPYVNISGASSATYVLTADDYMKYVTPTATGNGSYNGTVWPAVATHVNLRQIVTALGDITGTPAAGETLVAGAVTPVGASVAYQWQKTNSWQNPGSATYNNIPGATSSTYTIPDGIPQHGYYIRLLVQGVGAFVTDPESGLVSNYVGRISESPYKLTAISPITGVAQVGHKLTAGTIMPLGAPVTYQWLRKSTAAETYHEIPGATFSTYTTTADDYGSHIKVVVTGAGSYSGWLESEPTSVISARPVNGILAPVGTTVPGFTLSAGEIDPAGASVTYQWQRSDASGNNYADINGATLYNYIIDDMDIGRSLRVLVTGYGAYTGSATSSEAGPVRSTAPTVITAIGTINGEARVYQTLTAGALTPETATATYQWQRSSNSGGPYENILGATSSSYTLTPDDHGKYIKVLASGSGSYSGNVENGFIGPTAPYMITTISSFVGLARVGQPLVAGDVSPVDATVTYRWYLTNNTGKPGDDMGATTKSIVIPERSITNNSKTEGRYIRVEVTGYGAFYGTASSEWIQIQAPINLARIEAVGTITGTTTPGQTISAGSVTPGNSTVVYQWQRSATYNGTYQNISGANASTYLVQEEDLGHYLRVTVTGTGNYTGFATSKAIGHVVAEPIQITEISNILYTTVPELTLTAGTLTPTDAEVSYQWQVADTTNPEGTYSNIIGATSNTYTIPINQALGHYFKVVVTGRGIYSGTVTSNYTGPVVTEATPVTGVSISGVTKVGETLSVVSLMPEDATVTYQWYTLTELDENAIALKIPGAVYNTFTPSNVEYNYYIRVVVIGSGAYEGQAYATTADKVIGIITKANVSMTAPVAGEAAQTMAEIEAATNDFDYAITAVTWNEALENGTFSADTVYTAIIELTAKNNKIFTSVPFTPAVSSAESVGTTTVIGSGIGNKVTFTVTFTRTELAESPDSMGVPMLLEELEMSGEPEILELEEPTALTELEAPVDNPKAVAELGYEEKWQGQDE